MPRPSTYAPESPDYLIINESQTSNDIGIWVDTPPMPPMAERAFREIAIPDREETLIIADDSYKDMQLAVKAFIFNTSYDMTNVYSWIRGAKKLRFKNSDYYYRVKKVMPPTLNYSGHGKTMITLNFVVSPFRYFKTDPIITSTEQTLTVLNSGNTYCRPIYKITGSGMMTLTVNDGDYYTHEDATIHLPNVEDYVIIDAERTLAYKGSSSPSIIPNASWDDVLRDNENWSNLLDIAWGELAHKETIEVVASEGKIPWLPTGTGTIHVSSISGNVQVEILRNQRVI